MHERQASQNITLYGNIVAETSLDDAKNDRHGTTQRSGSNIRLSLLMVSTVNSLNYLKCGFAELWRIRRGIRRGM